MQMCLESGGGERELQSVGYWKKTRKEIDG